MNTLKVAAGLIMILAVSASGLLAAPDKNSTPSWGMSQGNITTYPKGHEATSQYNPDQVSSVNKQGQRWFQNTLNTLNIKK
ncbi:MAG: hypothetical protein HZC17_04530 [Candidatus Omnitrophica bacterium]|nr:hypothetical protein [Candidatus Omnitrophota bacterium]